MKRDRYKLNMCRSRMTPKSLAEAEGFRGRPRKVRVGVEGNPLSAPWSRVTPKSLAEAEGFRGRLLCTGRLRVSELPNLYQTGETTGTLSSRRRMTPHSMFEVQTVLRSFK